MSFSNNFDTSEGFEVSAFLSVSSLISWSFFGSFSQGLPLSDAMSASYLISASEAYPWSAGFGFSAAFEDTAVYGSTAVFGSSDMFTVKPEGCEPMLIDGTYDSVNWTVEEDGWLHVTVDGEWPSWEGDKPWRNPCGRITGLTLSGTRVIPDYEFYGLGNLTSFEWNIDSESESRLLSDDEGLRIGKEAFAGAGFEEFVVPASVTSIGDGCFYNCSKLARVFYSGATYIGGDLFGPDSTVLIYVTRDYRWNKWGGRDVSVVLSQDDEEDSANRSKRTGSSSGKLTGIILGVLIFVILVVVIIIVLVRRRSGNGSETSESTETTSSAESTTEMDSSDYEHMGLGRMPSAVRDPFDDSMELEASSSSRDALESSPCKGTNRSYSDGFIEEAVGISDEGSSNIMGCPGKTDRHLSTVFDPQGTDTHHGTDLEWSVARHERTDDSAASIDTYEEPFDSA